MLLLLLMLNLLRLLSLCIYLLLNIHIIFGWRPLLFRLAKDERSIVWISCYVHVLSTRNWSEQVVGSILRLVWGLSRRDVLCTVILPANWSHDYVLHIIVDWKIDCWFLHFYFLLVRTHLGLGDILFYVCVVGILSWLAGRHEVADVWLVVLECLINASICVVVLEMSLIIPLALWSILAWSLLRMGPVLARTYPWCSYICSVTLDQRLIHANQFTYQVIQPIFVGLALESSWICGLSAVARTV